MRPADVYRPHALHLTTHMQTCANSSDQPRALTLNRIRSTESDERRSDESTLAQATALLGAGGLRTLPLELSMDYADVRERRLQQGCRFNSRTAEPCSCS